MTTPPKTARPSTSPLSHPSPSGEGPGVGSHIHTGDALAILRTLPTESVHCVVTSPPYYGLRDYGVKGQIGLEPTPEAYIRRMVQVFREIRRILRKDGTCWLNLGDSWNGNGGAYGDAKSTLGGSKHSDIASSARRFKKTSVTLKPKDLIGIPWRVALALQADGWWLRQDIIWAKPNAMPESVTDRCTKAHEYLFLLTKSVRYWYDHAAIKEQMQPSTLRDKRLFDENYTADRRERDYPGQPQQGSGLLKPNGDKVNRRSVWNIATTPYKGAHFATFPIELPRLCIAAGCPERGIVLDPFFGAGTTGLAALELNRQYIGIELNPDYVTLAKKRLHPLQSQYNMFSV